jgi:hypothetical protein
LEFALERQPVELIETEAVVDPAVAKAAEGADTSVVKH